MAGKTRTHKSMRHMLRALLGIILIFSSILVSALLQSLPAFASMRILSVAQDNCPAGAKPDSNSILVVLLDRSGSLVAGNEPTDPNGYSGSATKALADLWPGQIAVIPFGNDQEPIVGPYAHSDIGGITSLKHYIDNNPPSQNADTPLRPAMDKAKTLFSNSIPACSKLVLITDGVPDAPSSPQQEVNAIKAQEIGWFHDHGLPISVFGLKIDKSTPNGQMADGLLNAIETGTGTGPAYDSVQSAENLASEVTSLYAKWRDLSFTPITKDTVNNTYPVSIDPFVDQATIISFYEQGVQNNPVTKNGQAIPQNSFEQTKDQHYEIDNILDPSHNAGTYIISTVGNAAASVYALVDSTLTLSLASLPAVVTTGQSLPIQAHFLHSGTPIVTGSTSPLSATVTISLNGHPTQSTTVLLYPQRGSDLYTGDYSVPTTGQKPGKTAVEVGTLSISVNGTAMFQGSSAKRGTSATTVQIDVPKAPPPPPYVCKKGVAQCFWEQYHTVIIGITPLVLLLLAILIVFLILQSRPPLVGTITNIPSTRRYTPEDISTVSLGKRPFFEKLLHKSVIESDELRRHPDAKGNLDFDIAKFALVAKSAHGAAKGTGKDNAGMNGHGSSGYTGSGKGVYIRPLRGNVADIEVRKQGQNMSIPVTEDVPLESGDIVRIEKKDNFQYS